MIYYDDGVYEYAEDDYYDDATLTGSDGEPLGEFDDEDVLSSLIILVLVAAIATLMWYRAQRQQAHRQEQDNAARQGQGQAAAAAAAAARRPLQPGEAAFAQWAGGGMGL